MCSAVSASRRAPKMPSRRGERSGMNTHCGLPATTFRRPARRGAQFCLRAPHRQPRGTRSSHMPVFAVPLAAGEGVLECMPAALVGRTAPLPACDSPVRSPVRHGLGPNASSSCRSSSTSSSPATRSIWSSRACTTIRSRTWQPPRAEGHRVGDRRERDRALADIRAVAAAREARGHLGGVGPDQDRGRRQFGRPGGGGSVK